MVEMLCPRPRISSLHLPTLPHPIHLTIRTPALPLHPPAHPLHPLLRIALQTLPHILDDTLPSILQPSLLDTFLQRHRLKAHVLCEAREVRVGVGGVASGAAEGGDGCAGVEAGGRGWRGRCGGGGDGVCGVGGQPAR